MVKKSSFPWLIKKAMLVPISVMAFVFAACNETLTKPYEGVWEPVGGGWDSFVITKNSMYGIAGGEQRLPCHYWALNSNTIKLKRCWLDLGDIDYTEKVSIYFDENNHLVIENYLPTFVAIYPPLYENLVLQRK